LESSTTTDGTSDPWQLTLPKPDPSGDDTRLMVSWHKGWWSAAGATWRAQLLVQRRRPGDMEWVGINKVSAEGQERDWDPSEGFGTLRLTVEFASADEIDGQRLPRALALPVSDYTEPVQVSFIGSFGTESLGRADEYFLVAQTSNAEARTELVLGGIRDLPHLTPPPSGDQEWEPKAPVTFQLLLVFRPLASVTRGDIDVSSGALVGVYRPKPNEGAEPVFEPMSFRGALPPEDLEGCWGYLLSFQRITAVSTRSGDERANLNSWEAILGAVFPTHGPSADPTLRESLVRPLPEYLGPVEVVTDGVRRGRGWVLLTPPTAADA